MNVPWEIHLMVATGFPLAASHEATITDLGPAWTVTALTEFSGLAGGRETNEKDKLNKSWEVKSHKEIRLEGKEGCTRQRLNGSKR